MNKPHIRIERNYSGLNAHPPYLYRCGRYDLGDPIRVPLQSAVLAALAIHHGKPWAHYIDRHYHHVDSRGFRVLNASPFAPRS